MMSPELSSSLDEAPLLLAMGSVSSFSCSTSCFSADAAVLPFARGGGKASGCAGAARVDFVAGRPVAGCAGVRCLATAGAAGASGGNEVVLDGELGFLGEVGGADGAAGAAGSGAAGAGASGAASFGGAGGASVAGASVVGAEGSLDTGAGS